MIFSNYHTHTTYCDGADTPEELVLEAIRLGCPEIGFSGHSHLTEHEGSMTVQGTLDYCAEIRRLQKQYADRINVRLGIEQDIYSVVDRSLYDYVIGAVHWIEKNGKLYAVDDCRETFVHTVQTVYDGDFYACVEDYYEVVATLWDRTHCDVIAHFDLITKYNEGNALFDPEHPRYRAAAERALDRLAECPVLLEVNTGAMARGYRTVPYPALWILKELRRRKCAVMINSDCHDRRKLTCGFDLAQALAREAGFSGRIVLRGGAFQETAL